MVDSSEPRNYGLNDHAKLSVGQFIPIGRQQGFGAFEVASSRRREHGESSVSLLLKNGQRVIYSTVDASLNGLTWHSITERCLTVKLRGRTITPDRRRGRTLSPGARGAKPLAHHGPLQRLLEVALARSGRTRKYHIRSPVAAPMSSA
jgi:hypothetical protein